ncbi:MAG: flagellar basal body rod protein FlgC [Calditrichia bacterium]
MPVDKLFGSLNISASGLSAQRKKLDVISSNIANAHTTRTEDGTPYRRRIAVMEGEKSTDFDVVLNEKSRKLATSNARHISGGSFSSRTPRQEVGVKAEIREDQSDFVQMYDPAHPDADEEGYVLTPNVNLVSEMVDMISASRSYEANLSTLDAAKKMAKAALDI